MTFELYLIYMYVRTSIVNIFSYQHELHIWIRMYLFVHCVRIIFSVCSFCVLRFACPQRRERTLWARRRPPLAGEGRPTASQPLLISFRFSFSMYDQILSIETRPKPARGVTECGQTTSICKSKKE